MAIIQIKRSQQLVRLRRLALSAQGLLQSQPFGRGLNGALAAIRHLGYVQIDTIAVIERAHHHVLFSRVPGYQPTMLNQMLVAKEIFEYWGHAASFLPMSDFRFSLPYKQAIKSGQTHWFKNPDRHLMAELLQRIRSEGPIRSRDLESSSKKGSGWWDWKPAKKALEQLYMEGDLMVSEREGMQKRYDLTERVLPAHVNSRMPDTDELAQHLVNQQLGNHGLVSLKGLTYLRRNTDLRKAVKVIVNERLLQRELEQVQLEQGEIYILEAGALERPTPRLNQRLTILSPFDNSVIQRERLNSLFSFNYQLECYVPEAKRRYGYFCLPLLYRSEFIGRMDCKAHRQSRCLEIKSLHVELPGVDLDQFIPAFVSAIKTFCHWQQCDSVSLTTTQPNNIAQLIRRMASHEGLLAGVAN